MSWCFVQVFCYDFFLILPPGKRCMFCTNADFIVIYVNSKHVLQLQCWPRVWSNFAPCSQRGFPYSKQEHDHIYWCAEASLRPMQLSTFTTHTYHVRIPVVTGSNTLQSALTTSSFPPSPMVLKTLWQPNPSQRALVLEDDDPASPIHVSFSRLSSNPNFSYVFPNIL